MTLPMIADFAIRLAGGLAAVLATTPWRLVPTQFFRTHCQVILGLAVLATLVCSRAPFNPWVFGLALMVAILAFGSSLCWGLGLPKLGVPTTIAIATVSAVLLSITADGPGLSLQGLNAASRLASAFLLGSTLTAMLLGHYYLTAPAMSIAPLRQFVRFMAAGLVARTAFAAFMLAFWWSGQAEVGEVGRSISPLFLAIRWGMGIGGVALATWLSWETVKIRSTQSATGILYIAMTLVLFGELSSLILARDSHLLI
jgi:hypothetical protein